MTSAAFGFPFPALSLTVFLSDMQSALPPTNSIPLEQCSPFIGNTVKVSFTVAVPLEALVEGGRAGLEKLAGSVLDKSIKLKNPLFRPVGSIPMVWDKPLAGKVLLQCVCELVPA